VIGPLRLPDPESSTCTYLVGDAKSGTAILIDPVDVQVQRDIGVLAALGLRLVWTVETHVHADHVTGAARLARLTGARTAVPAACGASGATRFLAAGDRLHFGSRCLEALHTPGHTAGSMCYLLRGSGGEAGHVFTGDTLLVGGCGRTDFQGGSAEALYDSITQVLFALPDDTVVWPGHDYAGKERSTIGHERRENARLAGRSKQEFVALMARLQLAPPTKIAVAVPANLRMGEDGSPAA
jgi:glyoxylase-like metal-dependent hydrolase (beta-lactamase superfamily II)